MTPLLNRTSIYRIDRNDRLVLMGGDWDAFAVDNGAPELASQNMISLSIWDFISGDLLRDVYRQIISHVRSGRSLRFDLRCDSPAIRRFLEMRVTPAPDGEIQFETVIKREEARSPQKVLDALPKADGAIIVTCSWCKKIKTGEGVWHEVEEAVNILKLFDIEPAPQLSHGMCSSCLETALAEVANR